MSRREYDVLAPLYELNPRFMPEDSLEHATELWLQNKKLQTIPECISTMARLKVLWLERNMLNNLPDYMSTLVSLTRLDMYSNRFTHLPDCLSTLTNLRQLYIYNNPITSLPIWITKMYALDVLGLENDGRVSVVRAPRGISTLPCWNNADKAGGARRIKDVVRKLELFTKKESDSSFSDTSYLRDSSSLKYRSASPSLSRPASAHATARSARPMSASSARMPNSAATDGRASRTTISARSTRSLESQPQAMLAKSTSYSKDAFLAPKSSLLSHSSRSSKASPRVQLIEPGNKKIPI
eukprot:TRINITY_DN3098_c0_g1_i5.p1 TRINITY_DN3098_c0_g1~~TRINITY_DN3098_c0_g1_i5.p1  ORF type:complete len:297 (+),score=48.71 TRINITY_DN3098_c0_g1_i5:44-934(+)